MSETVAFSNMNPGLEPYDLSGYSGVSGKNFYLEDKGLQRMVWRYSRNFTEEHRAAMCKHLEEFGELAGGILNELTIASHKEGKYGELQKYDKTGNRIDEIIYCYEQRKSRRIHYEHGIVNLDFHPEWKFDFPPIHRYALAYLANLNGEAGVTCPLAMTDGMILALKKLGSEDQKKKYLPLIAGKDSPSHFMCGQYVTERVGGSNVAANRTTARKVCDGKWILTGEKWFCSNPGDLWVTTAKIEGTNTVGLFLVPRFREDGSLNNYHILRKKDIIGSRGKVTAEVVYEGVEAEELGRPAHGLANLIRYIIRISRIHVGVGACGNARRAVMEALEYGRWRTAYGKKILEFPSYYRVLAEMNTLQTANLFANFRSIEYAFQKESLSEALIPLLKYKSSAQASWICRMAILCLGGNGIIADFSPVPRLLNDSIVNESWEGTHLIITDHFLHAISKKRVRDDWEEEIHSNIRAARDYPELKYPLAVFEEKLRAWREILGQSKEWREANRMFLADRGYELFSLSLFLQEAAEDLSCGEKESPYILLSEALAEIFQSGIDGTRDGSGAILKLEKASSILSY